MTFLGTFIGVIGLVLTTVIIIWHRAQAQAIAPAKFEESAPHDYPSISVIRPVRGKDVGAAENFAAALHTGYPGEVETIFVFDDDEDPGLPVAREVVDAHMKSGLPGTASVIVAGSPPKGRTGKLNAMVVGGKAAKHELVAFGDSDTRPDDQVLRCVVDALMSSEHAGSAFAPILVYDAPQAAGDIVYATMQNALYAPLAAYMAGEQRQLPFIMGQLMVFTREALDAIGGVETADGQLVDDMYIGKRVFDEGYKNVMSHHPLHIATGGMTLAEFFPVYRRWMMFSRNGLPFSFTWPQWLQGGGFWVAVMLTLLGVFTGHFIAALFPLAAIIAQTSSLLKLNVANGGAHVPAKFWYGPALFFVISPIVLGMNMWKHKVVWRGREYDTDDSAALAGVDHPTPSSKSATKSAAA